MALSSALANPLIFVIAVDALISYGMLVIRFVNHYLEKRYASMGGQFSFLSFQ